MTELRGVSIDMSMIGSTKLNYASTENMIKRNEEMRSNLPSDFSHLQSINNTNYQQQSQKLGEDEKLLKLTRLVLAEEQIKASSKNFSSILDKSESGADIINLCVTESILNSAYKSQQQKN